MHLIADCSRKWCFNVYSSCCDETIKDRRFINIVSIFCKEAMVRNFKFFQAFRDNFERGDSWLDYRLGYVATLIPVGGTNSSRVLVIVRDRRACCVFEQYYKSFGDRDEFFGSVGGCMQCYHIKEIKQIMA